MGTTSSKKYFPALTGLRAVAALLVFSYHAAPHTIPASSSLLHKGLVLLLQQGNIGLNIFFVLSGFLITARYAKSIQLTSTWFRQYLQNRFARVYPLYFLLTSLTFGVMLVHPLHAWYEWPLSATTLDKVLTLLANLTLTRTFFEQMVFWGVPTAWTLTIEESFYLSAPFLLLGLRRTMRLLYVYPVLLLALGASLVAFCTYLRMPLGLMGNMNMMVGETFFGRSIEFLVGMGLALWIKSPAYSAPFSGRARATVVGILGILAIVVALCISENLFPGHSIKAICSTALLNNVLLPLPIACLLWGLIYERTWLQQLLQSKPFILLGKSSYAFYLIHIGLIDTLFCSYVTDYWLARLIAYTVLSIALYQWLENPLHQRFRVGSQPRTYEGEKQVASPKNA